MDSYQIRGIVATNKLNARDRRCRIGRVFEKSTGRQWFDYFAVVT